MVVHSLVDQAAAAAPDARAVRDSRGGWNYRELVRLSHGFAAWLAERGVRARDRVLVQLPNAKELVGVVYGASRAGASLVPLNPGMKEFHLSSVLADSEPSLVIVADAAAPAMRELTAVPVHGITEVWHEVEALAASGRQATTAGPAAHEAALLIYTSGSTAAPKGVVCPHRQVTFSASAINAVLRYHPGDVVFTRLPLSFDYGLYQIFLAALGHAELVLAGDAPDTALLSQLRACGATIVPVVPSLGAMLATLGRREPGSAPTVRMFTNTGAALPASTIEGLRETFPGARVVRMYGITECKRVTIMPPEQDRDRPDAVGLPLPGTEVLILDGDGQPVPTGQVGEIVVVGPNVMAGYWRAPELTARTYRPSAETGEIRMHTGDYGLLDEDGYLYFEGRRDDMFKRKGHRMSTVEIEAAAMDVPGVRAAAVLPPTDRHDLTLFVESELAPQAVLRELAKRLEPQKVPASCHVLERFPLTLNGKNERKQLTALLEGSTA
ncbi:AMP-binding protein [Kutzneria sp. CA-103260]|uniref:AMP-binding protein n=1 Tax=Kutzneria sp. CA-103260 TaxID=2802641 RepID=UPI001BAA09B4|nr:AMP-binding protein [Kutzneria sp. CA-103260]